MINLYNFQDLSDMELQPGSIFEHDQYLLEIQFKSLMSINSEHNIY